MVKVEVDKTPLFKDVESQRQRDENCCKHLWIATMILLAGIICGIGTYPAVYGLVERDGPSPTDMMDEACYAVYSTFFKYFFNDLSAPPSDGFIKKAEFAVTKYLALKRFEYHVELRSSYYIVDPILVLKCIFIASTILYLIRICGCPTSGQYFILWFDVYYYTLVLTLGVIALISIPLFEKTNPRSCERQFWGF